MIQDKMPFNLCILVLVALKTLWISFLKYIFEFWQFFLLILLLKIAKRKKLKIIFFYNNSQIKITECPNVLFSTIFYWSYVYQKLILAVPYLYI